MIKQFKYYPHTSYTLTISKILLNTILSIAIERNQNKQTNY